MTKVTYFGSGSNKTMQKLSNLAFCEIAIEKAFIGPEMASASPILIEVLETHGKLIFPSTEHIWQALKATDCETLLRFTSSGDLGQWTPSVFLKTVVGQKLRKEDKNNADKANQQVKKSIRFWKDQKSNLIGIIAKMASNEKPFKALGLGGHMKVLSDKTLTPIKEEEVWVNILSLKFKQSPEMGAILKSTGKTTLIEFDKGARRRQSYWGGLYDDEKKIVIGKNMMGQYLTRVRQQLFGENK